MKLSISNIAWETDRFDEHIALLETLGCDGMELSPSMLWPEPIDVEHSELKALKTKMNQRSLAIPSMHSLLYPRPDLSLFESHESRANLVSYIIRLAEIANFLEIPVMVYGSGRSRKIGSRNRTQSLTLMVEAFHQIAERIDPLGVSLLIEPLTTTETDTINSMAEAFELQQAVNHPAFGLHADLRSSFIVGEDQKHLWQMHGKHIKHCHVGNPGLAPPDATCQDHSHAAEAIKQSEYDGYLSIEMIRNFGETTQVVQDALSFVRETYF